MMPGPGNLSPRIVAIGLDSMLYSQGVATREKSEATS